MKLKKEFSDELYEIIEDSIKLQTKNSEEIFTDQDASINTDDLVSAIYNDVFEFLQETNFTNSSNHSKDPKEIFESIDQEIDGLNEGD
jgi:hypothetical protein